MNESDTPRTDKRAAEISDASEHHNGHGDWAGFARQLEKELAERTRELREAKARKYVCGVCANAGMGDEYTDWVDQLESANTALKAENERLWNQLAEIHSIVGEVSIGRVIEHLRDIVSVRAANASLRARVGELEKAASEVMDTQRESGNIAIRHSYDEDCHCDLCCALNDLKAALSSGKEGG